MTKSDLKSNFLYSTNELKNDFYSFYNFLRNNKFSVILCWFFLLLTYGVKLFWYSIGIDTEIVLNDYENYKSWWYGINRAGLVLVKKIFRLTPFNPYAANFLMICTMFLSLMVFSFIFYSISKKLGSDPRCMFILPCIFITHPFFAEQFVFTLQCFEVSFGILLMFLAAFSISKWIFDSKNILHLCIGLISLSLSFWIYQAIVFLYITVSISIFIFYVLNESETTSSNLINKNHKITVIKYLSTFAFSYGLYFVLNKITKCFLHASSAEYLDDMISWGKVDTLKRILEIFKYVFRSKKIILALCMFVVFFVLFILFSKKVNFVLPYLATVTVIAGLHLGTSYLGYCLIAVGGLLLSINFLCQRKVSNRIIFFLAVTGLLISPFILSILLGHRCLPRSQFSLQFVLALIPFLLIQTLNLNIKNTVVYKILSTLVCTFSLGLSFTQGYKTAVMLYYDYMKYQSEVDVANKISERIGLLDIEDINNVPVVFVGKMCSPVVPKEIKGNMLGTSFFEMGTKAEEITFRALGFMRTIGYNYKNPTGKDCEKAVKIAQKMKSWPSSEAIKYENGIIIVKLSEDLIPESK